ncbi:MAG: cadherin-like beta sandwich domain-containing protein [Coprobacillus sp.]
MGENKLLGYTLSLLLCFGIMFGYTKPVFAASYSVSVSTSSVSAGGNVTVSVNGSGCEGSFSVSANNGAQVTGNSTIWTGESTTVKAGSGAFTITVSPVSVSDSSNASNITGSLSAKSKSISIKSASTGGNGTTNTPTTPSAPDTRSKDNTLSSLSVSTGELSPAFSADKTSYSVQLTSDITKMTIEAKTKDSKAKVSGTGEKSLVIGSQTFEVIVTAENGSKKTYAITVDVAEKPTVFTQFGDEKLGVLIDVSKVKAPEGYSGVNLTFESQTVSGWTNEKTGLTLAYLMDEKGNKNFYIVEDGKVVGKYEVLTILGKNYTLLPIPADMLKQNNLNQSKVKVGDIEIEGWSFTDKEHTNYSVIYLMNDAGEKGLYTYEGTEGTLQKYVASNTSSNSTLTYVLIGTTAVFAITTGVAVAMYFNFKKKSISAIKDYYDSKNQGE